MGRYSSIRKPALSHMTFHTVQHTQECTTSNIMLIYNAIRPHCHCRRRRSPSLRYFRHRHRHRLSTVSAIHVHQHRPPLKPNNLECVALTVSIHHRRPIRMAHRRPFTIIVTPTSRQSHTTSAQNRALILTPYSPMQ